MLVCFGVFLWGSPPCFDFVPLEKPVDSLDMDTFINVSLQITDAELTCIMSGIS